MYVFGEEEIDVAYKAEKNNGIVDMEDLKKFYNDNQIRVRFFPFIKAPKRMLCLGV